MAKHNRKMMDLLRSLPIVEDELRRAGLFKSATLMNKVVRSAGFEAADKIKPVTITES